MKILDADVRIMAQEHHYAIRLEATERAAALLFALGVAFRSIGPEEDSGRAWYEFTCSDQLSDALREVVDFIGDVVYSQPVFGQLLLFDGVEAKTNG